jgi:hypothetical protein
MVVGARCRRLCGSITEDADGIVDRIPDDQRKLQSLSDRVLERSRDRFKLLRSFECPGSHSAGTKLEHSKVCYALHATHRKDFGGLLKKLMVKNRGGGIRSTG